MAREEEREAERAEGRGSGIEDERREGGSHIPKTVIEDTDSFTVIP